MLGQAASLGFTLAEVLITLGIIGVVSAITLPAVIQNTENKHLTVLAKKIYSETAQVLQNMQNEGVDINDFRDGSAGNLCSEISKYYDIECGLRINKSCDFNNTVKKYVALDKKSTIGYTIMDDGFFTTKDNRMYFCEQMPSSTVKPVNLFITVDINGTAKPNILGRDLFTFWIDTSGFLKPMGTEDSIYPAKQYCNLNVNILHRGQQGFGCMFNVLNNIKY